MTDTPTTTTRNAAMFKFRDAVQAEVQAVRIALGSQEEIPFDVVKPHIKAILSLCKQYAWISQHCNGMGGRNWSDCIGGCRLQNFCETYKTVQKWTEQYNRFLCKDATCLSIKLGYIFYHTPDVTGINVPRYDRIPWGVRQFIIQPFIEFKSEEESTMKESRR